MVNSGNKEEISDRTKLEITILEKGISSNSSACKVSDKSSVTMFALAVIICNLFEPNESITLALIGLSVKSEYAVIGLYCFSLWALYSYSISSLHLNVLLYSYKRIITQDCGINSKGIEYAFQNNQEIGAVFWKKAKFYKTYVAITMTVYGVFLGFYIWFGYSILSYTGESDFIRYSSVFIVMMLFLLIIMAVTIFYHKVTGDGEAIRPLFYEDGNDKPT